MEAVNSLMGPRSGRGLCPKDQPLILSCLIPDAFPHPNLRINEVTFDRFVVESGHQLSRTRTYERFSPAFSSGTQRYSGLLQSFGRTMISMAIYLFPRHLSFLSSLVFVSARLETEFLLIQICRESTS